MKLVFPDNNRPVTDSIIVAETFGKRHDHVLRDIRELECSEEFRVSNFGETPYTHPQNGQKYPKYLITQDGFSFLVMGYTGKEAARFKEMYINEFNRMREQLASPYQLPQNYKEALVALISQVEKNDKLETEKLMLQQQVKEYQPKASYLDQILQSKDTITITQIAKDYGLTGQSLNQILHEEKVQYKLGGQWLLYQKHQDQGYTKSQTIDVLHNSGDRTVKMNTRWTQKGRLFIHEILSKRDIVPFMDREHQKAN